MADPKGGKKGGKKKKEKREIDSSCPVEHCFYFIFEKNHSLKCFKVADRKASIILKICQLPQGFALGPLGTFNGHWTPCRISSPKHKIHPWINRASLKNSIPLILYYEYCRENFIFLFVLFIDNTKNIVPSTTCCMFIINNFFAGQVSKSIAIFKNNHIYRQND